MIFREAVEDVMDACTLSAVCYHWRELAQSFPVIWHHVSTAGLNAELFNHAAIYSKGLDLSLSHRETPSYRPRRVLGGVRKKLVEAVLPVGRGESGLGLDSLDSLMEGRSGFPNLRDLTLDLEARCFHCNNPYHNDDPDTASDAPYIALYYENAPKLTRLRLT